MTKKVFGKLSLGLCCGALMTSMLGMGFSAAAADAVVDDNFETYTSIKDVQNYYSLANTGSLILEGTTVDNKAIWFRKSNTQPNPDFKATWDDIKGGFAVISTTFKQSATTPTRLQQVWNYTDSKRPYILYTYNVDGNKGSLQIDYTDESGNNKTDRLYEYAINQWYQVSTILDLDQQLVYVMVDGQLINPSGFKFKQATDMINGMNIQTNDDSCTGRMFIDNLYVDKFQSFEAAKAAIVAHNIKADTASSKFSAADKMAFEENIEPYLSVLRTENNADALNGLNSEIDAAIPSAKKLVFTGDFWKLSESNKLSDATEYKALSNAVPVKENGQTVAKLTRGTSGRARILKQLSNLTPEGLEINYSFMQKEKSAIDCVSRATEDNGTISAYLIKSDGSNLILDGGNNQSIDIVENYAANTWYDITVDLDYLNQTVSCKVNNKLVGSVPFLNDFSSSQKSIARVFDTFTNLTGEYYIGEITVYTDDLQAPDYFVSKTVFKDANGAESKKLTAGGTIDKMYVTKNVSGNAVVYTAVYDDGILKAVDVQDISNEAAGVTVEVPVDLQLPESASNAVVKQFIWGDNNQPEAVNTLRTSDATNTNIFIVGDSTVATYDYATYYPQTGWGQMLGNYFNNVTVKNYAIPGSSLKQSYKRGVLDEVLNEAQAGDFLLIQFAHNDSKFTDLWYSDAISDYRAYLKHYAQLAQSKGMTPIFVTSPMRRVNSVFGGTSSLISYADEMKSVGRELDIPVVDLLSKSVELVDCLTENDPDGAKKLYLFLDANDSRYFGEGSEYTSSVYNTSSGVSDNTHFCAFGADTLAGIVAEGIENIGNELSARVDEVKHVPVEPGE